MTDHEPPPYVGHPDPHHPGRMFVDKRHAAALRPTGARTPAQSADQVVSFLWLGLTWIVLPGCAFISLFLVAFADSCSTPGCSLEAYALSILGANGVALVAAICGTVLTSQRIGRRDRAWPYALTTAVLVVGAYVGGAFLAFSWV